MSEETLSYKWITPWGKKCFPCTCNIWSEIIWEWFFRPWQNWSRLFAKSRFYWDKYMCPVVFMNTTKAGFTQLCSLVSQKSSTRAMIVFFESFRLRHSQFPLVTQNRSLPTYPNGNNPQLTSAHYSNINTNLNQRTKCLDQMYFFTLQMRSFR